VTIDIHAHTFHPKIAARAVSQLRDHYRIDPVGIGTADDLVRRLAAAGIDRAAVHAAATTPAQVIPANNWAMELARKYPMFIPFGTVHPGYADIGKELDRLERAGIRGIKIHADFQGFRLDDPDLFPVLEALEGRFVVMFHVGDRLPPGQNPSCPIKVAAIHKTFPELTMIAAHLGGLLHWEHSLEHLAGSGVYLDTSSSLPFIGEHLLRAILDKHPAERVLFGSDYPLYDPGTELKRLRTRLDLGDEAMELLLTAAEALFPVKGGDAKLASA